MEDNYMQNPEKSDLSTIKATRQSARKRKLKKILRQTPAYLLVGAWSLFTIFIIGWIAFSSLKTNQAVFKEVWKLPTKLHFENFARAWLVVKLGDYFLNSVLVVISSVIIILIVSAPASYILSRVKFRGRNLLTTVFTAGMGVPYPLLFIPLFVIIASLKLHDSLVGLTIVYVSLSIPFTVYILTGFFTSLPRELEEAAIIDGCTDYQVFFKVMLPLASPGLITAAIFNFIGLWNEYQLALIFINSSTNRTLSLGLYALQNAMQYTGDWVGLFAGIVIIMIPTVILYIFLSEKMIAGITMGAAK
jgi:ABC-type glycerol-3-phosphate transport system permease component